MSILSSLKGTFQTAFQIGKGGPKVKNNSGVIEARNAADLLTPTSRPTRFRAPRPC